MSPEDPQSDLKLDVTVRSDITDLSGKRIDGVWGTELIDTSPHKVHDVYRLKRNPDGPQAFSLPPARGDYTRTVGGKKPGKYAESPLNVWIP